MAEKTWKVVREDARGRTQTVFEGSVERDARKFIADNYPRVHVEPGSATASAPDAVLVSPSGNREVHYGPGYVDESGDYEDGFGPMPDDDDDEDDDAPAPRKRAATKKTTAPDFKTGQE